MASPTIRIANDFKREELRVHHTLEELRKPDELNELIMISVNRIVEKLSRQCNPMEVTEDIATLTGLIRIRKSRIIEKRGGGH